MQRRLFVRPPAPVFFYRGMGGGVFFWALTSVVRKKRGNVLSWVEAVSVVTSFKVFVSTKTTKNP